MAEISFIIPHKGREEMLKQTIDAILQQEFDTASLEIIIVSQNEILTSAKELSDNSPVQIFYRSPSDTISALRNFGVARSSGTYLAFIDADVAVAPNWCQAVKDELDSQANTVMISTPQKCNQDNTETDQVRTALQNLSTGQYVDAMAGSNLFLLRTTFEQAEGFPESLTTCEDIAFTAKVAHSGKLYFTEKSYHYHLGEDRSYRQLFSKEIWRGQSNLRSLKGRKIPLAELPSIVLPLAIFFAFILLILGIATQELLWSLIAILTITLPIFAYSARLFGKTHSKLTFWLIFKFYSVYFPARAIGSVVGAFKQFSYSGKHYD